MESLNWKMVLSVLGGAAVGYAYYRLIGCRTGTCPITARWWTASGYGAMVGFLFSRT